jgi:hypothetical protein
VGKQFILIVDLVILNVLNFHSEFDLSKFYCIVLLPALLHSTTSIAFDLRKLRCDCLSTKQKQKRNREEPSLDQTEELDAVDAFKTCHTSSKRGLSESAREALVSLFICFV